MQDTNAKIRNYITKKYKLNPDVGYFCEISNALKKMGNTVAQVAGQTGQTAAELTAIFGSQSVPGWGQVACLGEHAFRSKFNGNEQDSTGDYDLLVRVNKIK